VRRVVVVIFSLSAPLPDRGLRRVAGTVHHPPACAGRCPQSTAHGSRPLLWQLLPSCSLHPSEEPSERVDRKRMPRSCPHRTTTPPGRRTRAACRSSRSRRDVPGRRMAQRIRPGAGTLEPSCRRRQACCSYPRRRRRPPGAGASLATGRVPDAFGVRVHGCQWWGTERMECMRVRCQEVSFRGRCQNSLKARTRAVGRHAVRVGRW